MGNPDLYLLWIENVSFVYQNILGTRIAETHPPFLSRCWSVHLDRHMFCQRRALRREHSCETNGTASYEFVAQFLGEKEVEEEGGRKMKREREGGGEEKRSETQRYLLWNSLETRGYGERGFKVSAVSVCQSAQHLRFFFYILEGGGRWRQRKRMIVWKGNKKCDN